ncbi:hypothetical protein L1887_38383 [Cichorium endivia]|nr:hypothetical protein L1887_38383 [Cichorium endivia]
MTKPPSTIMEHEQQGDHISDDYYNYDDQETISGNNCGCFRLFSYYNYTHHEGETTAFIHHKSGDIRDKTSWLMNRFKRFREFSELIAGPKWKNFIRKFSKKPKKGNSSFQYDPESYALNFNDGVGDDSEDGSLPRSFSTRFAPHSSSMAS